MGAGNWPGCRVPHQLVVFTLQLQAAALFHVSSATSGFPKPPMGFNTCNVGCGNYSFPNEAFVAATAEDMVRLGLKDVGYEYVNVSISILHMQHL